MSKARPLEFLPRNGRRHVLLRAVSTECLSTDEVAVKVRRAMPSSTDDASIERRRLREAIRDLRREGMVAKAPWGWTITARGQAVLNRTEGHA